MSSQSSQSVLSMNDYKAVHTESSSVTKPYSGKGHLHQENRLLPRPVWFKGSRDRGFRENIAAWNQFKQPIKLQHKYLKGDYV